MGLVFGSLAWLVGAVLLTASYQQLRKINPDERIPHWFGRPTHHPGRLSALRVAAIFLLMMSVFAWSDVFGYWAAGLILVAGIPALVVVSQHNRAVGA